jgi:hypothetical protein
LTCSEANEALIWAIVSLFCCGFILGPIALIRANTAKNIIAANPQMSGSSGTATAAIVIAIIGIVVHVCLSLLYVLGSSASH